MPPVIPLFAVAVLILAQLFHLLFPRRITYLRRILLAAAGVLVGEVAASTLHLPGPRLGDLHPLWDLLATAPLQLLGNRFLR
ncbi:MAG TPA: hypothetical protein VG245_08875 [Candidatus Dormibacteraeota bacterium]|jgi:hypothetical protein|nr:hypothetical protein [Candidatus Dormibacteraeota bacterium]